MAFGRKASAKNNKKTPRVNLDIPYTSLKYVKSIGGIWWDANHKVWYTYVGAYQAKYLTRFMSKQDKKAYGFI